MSNEGFNWEGYENGPKAVIFNGGKAGEVKCTAKMRNTAGETGPQGNPLPPYMMTLTDPNNVDAEGNLKTLEVAFSAPRPIDPSLDENAAKKAKNAEKATMLTARWAYEAMNPGAAMPMGSTPLEAFNLCMEACVAAGTVEVRAFVHYEKWGKPHRYLSMVGGFNKGIVSKNSTEVFADTSFMTRPPAPNAEGSTTPTTAVAGSDDLPF